MKFASFHFLVNVLISLAVIKVANASFVSTKNFEERFHEEEVKRHVEIRKELEREALPFLEYKPQELNMNMVNLDIDIFSSKVENEDIGWIDYFSTYSYVDIVMGLFSAIVLGFGTFYFAWRLNPLANKIVK